MTTVQNLPTENYQKIFQNESCFMLIIVIVANQCLEFGVPKVNINRMNQFLLYAAMTLKAPFTF